MKYLSFFLYYLIWHYGRGVVEMIINFRNFLKFIYNFFSISILLRTLFSPFQRLTEHYKGGLDVSAFFESVITNLISRSVGFLARIFIIVLGSIILIVAFLIEGILLVVWIIAPVLLLFIFCGSLISIFKAI